MTQLREDTAAVTTLDRPSATVISVEGLTKTYGQGESAKVAIDRIDFHVEAGEFVSIVGPSGAGKTTLLKCLTGLLAPSGGRTCFEGVPIEAPPEKLALVFQDYGRSLFAWMTVGRNVELPLLDKGIAKQERRRRVAEALEAVGLPDTARRYPWQLSGGMQQRVALARALAYRPDCLVMDEPFASVDAQTRFELEDLILELRRAFGITVLFVTHDIDEAVYLSDRIVVLTRSPASVRAVLDVDLPRPRDQAETKRNPRFGELRTELLELVQSQRPGTGSAADSGSGTGTAAGSDSRSASGSGTGPGSGSASEPRP
jgi:NitT/TauT family transport system ATP-binding protein